jgi:hypothetical protein
LCRFLFGFYAAFIILGGYAAVFYSSWRLCRRGRGTPYTAHYHPTMLAIKANQATLVAQKAG